MALIKNKRKTLRTKKTKGKKLRKKNTRRKSIKKGGAFFEDSLPDDLKLGKLLGKGSWGNIYVVNWKENEQKKYGVLKVSKARNQIEYEINLNEVEILKYLTEEQNRITCPSNISIYGFKRFPDTFELEILMEYFCGKDLSKLYFYSLRVWNIIKNQLINAVNCLHNLNVVHRDIKPANIMINDDTLDIKMIDFGLACHKTGDQLPENRVCKNYLGTPWYISPEIYMFYVNQKMSSHKIITYKAFEKITWEMLIASDIWALGMTLYTLAYKKPLLEFYFNKIGIKTPTNDDIKSIVLKIGNGEKIKSLISHESSNKDATVLPLILPLLEVDVKKRIDNFKTLVETIKI